ncbi:MAG: FAD binding domain-containing protein [Bdellovibrionia bacterium]
MLDPVIQDRHKIVFYVNRVRHELEGKEAFMTLAEFVRYQLSLTGTKIVCAEGDCGACTVLLGNIHEADQKQKGELNYKAVNACIIPLYLLDCHHVITVEGLSDQGKLHPVQSAMIQHHGAQCGYCTPGFICAMAAYAEDSLVTGKPLTRKKASNFLTGNLCRCTGYEPILNAAENLELEGMRSLQEIYHDENRNEEFRRLSQIPVRSISSVKSSEPNGTGELTLHLPVAMNHALALKQKNPKLRIIAGSTDIGVFVNKGKMSAEQVMSLYHIPDLYKVQVSPDQIWVGARVTLTQLEKILENEIPEKARLLRIFASPQIKNQGTLIGNIVNGSPIGDTIPYLMISAARVEIAGITGIRQSAITEFYQGYKKFDLKAEEIVTGVTIPLPAFGTQVRLYKVSLRKDLDISAVTFAGSIKVSDGRCANICLAYGGVGPTVMRMFALEDELRGKIFERKLFEDAADQMVRWMTPLSDLRGSKEYRLLLCRNLLLKFYDEVKLKFPEQKV